MRWSSCGTGSRLPKVQLAKINESPFDVAKGSTSEEILLSRQHPHSRGDDRERITRARQEAEALFAAALTNARITARIRASRGLRRRRLRLDQSKLILARAYVRKTTPSIGLKFSRFIGKILLRLLKIYAVLLCMLKTSARRLFVLAWSWTARGGSRATMTLTRRLRRRPRPSIRSFILRTS